jgi:hypothetical protein
MAPPVNAPRGPKNPRNEQSQEYHKAQNTNTRSVFSYTYNAEGKVIGANLVTGPSAASNTTLAHSGARVDPYYNNQQMGNAMQMPGPPSAQVTLAPAANSSGSPNSSPGSNPKAKAFVPQGTSQAQGPVQNLPVQQGQSQKGQAPVSSTTPRRASDEPKTTAGFGIEHAGEETVSAPAVVENALDSAGTNNKVIESTMPQSQPTFVGQSGSHASSPEKKETPAESYKRKIEAHNQLLRAKNQQLLAEYQRLQQVYKDRYTQYEQAVMDCKTLKADYQQLPADHGQLAANGCLIRRQLSDALTNEASKMELLNKVSADLRKSKHELAVSEISQNYQRCQIVGPDKNPIGRAIAKSLDVDLNGLNLGSAALGGVALSSPRAAPPTHDAMGRRLRSTLIKFMDGTPVNSGRVVQGGRPLTFADVAPTNSPLLQGVDPKLINFAPTDCPIVLRCGPKKKWYE